MFKNNSVSSLLWQMPNSPLTSYAIYKVDYFRTSFIAPSTSFYVDTIVTITLTKITLTKETKNTT
jgi:hypothetical protein